MQSIRNSILRHVRVRGSAEWWILAENWNVLKQLSHKMFSSTANSPDQIMDRVIGLVKKFDKIDVSKVINGCHHNSLQVTLYLLLTFVYYIITLLVGQCSLLR